MTTSQRMQKACAAVDRGDSVEKTYIGACGAEADRMVEEVTEQLHLTLSRLAGGHALTFDQVTTINRARASRWHPGFPNDDTWSIADWSNAMCGEAGEAANVVKKIRRYESGLQGVGDPSEDDLRSMLAHELADVYLYLDLVASKVGIDLPAAVVEKFNIVSERQGFPERL